MEQPKTEKPFMLQQLIFHGLLAGALLICGWLFPAKYKALHPKVLEQAGLASAVSKNPESIDGNRTAPVEKIEGEPEVDALKQFIEGKYRASGDDSIRALLKLGDEKAKGTNTQTTTTYPSALSIFVNPANRVRYMDILSGFKEPEQNLYRLRELAPQYRSAAALVAYLDGRRKLHSDLRKDLLTYMANGQTNQVQRTMHAVITLGTRLSFEQMGEITGHTSSPKALIDFAKIAKIQTILYPFNSYDINPDKKIEANELKGLALGKEKNFSKYAQDDKFITPEEWKKIPAKQLPQIGAGKEARPGKFEDFDVRSNSISREELESVHPPLAQADVFKEIAGEDQLISRKEWIELGFMPLHLTAFPVIYTASVWSGNPEGVANYLMLYGKRGEQWLVQAMNGAARRSGSGALESLLERQLPLTWGGPALGSVASFSYQHPTWALVVKYLLIGLGCLVIIRAWNSFFVLTAIDKESLQAMLLRRRAMAVALLILLFAISEPFLFQSAYSSEYQIAINVPQLSTENIETLNDNKAMLANTSVILNVFLIVLFAVIQIAVFTTCTNKIREIMSGKGDSRLKLQLLENEDNLFDMGLYIGIAGTALTLAAKLLMETDVINLSAAYASNIFGILCVALVKIKHLRPSRESLIRDDEGGTDSLGTA